MTATPDTVIPNRIALGGRMGAGKTHIATLLEDRGWTRMSFAAPLKAAAAHLQDNPTRELMQQLASVTRRVEPHPLVAHMAGVLLDGGPTKIVVDDVRFGDELRLLQSHGFKAYLVVAPHEVRRRRLKANGRIERDSQMNHATESPAFGASLMAIHNYRRNGFGDLTDQEIIDELVRVAQA